MTDWEDMPRTVFHVLATTDNDHGYNYEARAHVRPAHERLDLHIDKLRILARKHGRGMAVIRVTTELVDQKEVDR